MQMSLDKGRGMKYDFELQRGGESNFPVERGKNLTGATLITKGWGMAIIQGVKYKKNIFQYNCLRKIHESMFRDLALKNLYFYFF